MTDYIGIHNTISETDNAQTKLRRKLLIVFC